RRWAQSVHTLQSRVWFRRFSRDLAALRGEQLKRCAQDNGTMDLVQFGVTLCVAIKPGERRPSALWLPFARPEPRAGMVGRRAGAFRSPNARERLGPGRTVGLLPAIRVAGPAGDSSRSVLRAGMAEDGDDLVRLRERRLEQLTGRERPARRVSGEDGVSGLV